MDKETKKRLLERALHLKALVYGDFTLSSGLKSNFYFDGRLLSMDPEASNIIAEWVLSKAYEDKVNFIGGPAVAAVPIIGAAVALSFEKEKTVSGFFVRSDKKEHGTQKQIEGNFDPDLPVIALDDTVSTGGSLFQAIDVIENMNGKIKLVLCVLDRKMGGSETIKQKGYKFQSIFEINSAGELV